MKILGGQAVTRKGKIKTEHKKAKTPVKIGPAVLAILVFGILGASGLFFKDQVMSASFFKIKQIHLVVTNGKEDAFLNRAKLLATSGLSEGSNLMDLNVKSLSQRMLKNQWIETIRIDRIWPNSVTIHVTRRHPAALVQCEGFQYVDARGKIIANSDTEQNYNVPVFTSFNCPKPEEPALKKALGLVEMFEKKKYKISEVNFSKDFGYTLYMAEEPFPIILGESEFEKKFERFEKIYHDLKENKLVCASLDLNYSQKGIVRLKSI
jgi:cell division protein FtsQ